MEIKYSVKVITIKLLSCGVRGLCNYTAITFTVVINEIEVETMNIYQPCNLLGLSTDRDALGTKKDASLKSY